MAPQDHLGNVVLNLLKLPLIIPYSTCEKYVCRNPFHNRREINYSRKKNLVKLSLLKLAQGLMT